MAKWESFQDSRLSFLLLMVSGAQSWSVLLRFSFHFHSLIREMSSWYSGSSDKQRFSRSASAPGLLICCRPWPLTSLGETFPMEINITPNVWYITVHRRTKLKRIHAKFSKHMWVKNLDTVHPSVIYSMKYSLPTCWDWFKLQPTLTSIRLPNYEEKDDYLCKWQAEESNEGRNGDHEGRSGRKLQVPVPLTHIDAPGTEWSRCRLSNMTAPQNLNTRFKGRLRWFAAALKLNSSGD